MAKTSAVVKAQLQAAGKWEAFLKLRDENKAAGMAPKDAHAAAMAEVESMEVVAAPARNSAPKAAPADGELAVAPMELLGKAAPAAEVVLWVARNIDNPAPDPAECPDPFAWTLLRLCKSSVAFQQFFVEKLWSKLIPTRAQTEQPNTVLDGKPTLELIERIMALRDKTKEEAA